ncbi:hypothetical protein [Variovorax sp. PAMC26660]|uniref:hypothetical protein n=1 Tax=Variovorax sp. PAMC26660 TaxID=2762322 RepID=UPI00164E6695|nr:hypothetical protein [Variovorax sp. PAMC26660]QNK70813.1 hypothetical protein H7F35_14515 [Variovorax sp. PAMC26660]
MASIEQARAALAPHGALASQTAAEHWRGDIPLPPVIATFYEQIGPLGEWINERVGHAGLEVPNVGNPFSIPPLARLWQLQAGYRWHGITGERIADWPDHWLVVADQGADPFIFDLRTGAIQFARHGAGTWQDDEPIFADIFQMAACLGTIGQFVDEAGDELLLDDDSVDPAQRARLVKRLAPLLGDTATAEAILDDFGW